MKKTIITLTAILLLSQGVFAQKVLTKDERMQWWREARFGMFIHWGVYSIPAGTWNGRQIGGIGEWIMNRGKIPVADYQAMAKQFNPVKYDPDAWVRMAKDAGMKYIVITSKHHDGFALFGSKASKWNVVDATAYGKDLLRPLAEACKKYGIKLGFYYSQAQDWNNPGGSAARRPTKEGWANPDSVIIDAYTKEHNGHWDPAQEKKTFAQYIDDVAVPQVKEILTNYGDLAVLWWDTPTNMTDDAATKLQALLAIQPAIITNDRLKLADLDGTDWETCMTMNGTWGYKSYDHNYKTPETLIRNLLDIASKGGNFLLNVGPTDLGEFPQESVDILAKMGQWMKVNGEAVYGTKASPWGLYTWGRCTKKDTKDGTILYFSVFNWPADGKLSIPGLKNGVSSASLLTTGAKLRTTGSADGLTINLPAAAPDPIASVIKVVVRGKVENVTSTQPKK
jgi:alpha-L-fucosidase